MSPENDRRNLGGKVPEIKVPGPDHRVTEWQPEGDVDSKVVPFRGPRVTKHRRKDDPKPPNPHEII